MRTVSGCANGCLGWTRQESWLTRKNISPAPCRENAASRAFTCGIWSDGRLVGIIGHNRIDWANRAGFPAYWLAPDSEGKGIMTHCCRAVIEHAFGELRLNRLFLATATDNRRAQKIPEKLGFTRVSTLRKAEWLYDHHVDHYIYSLLAPPLRNAGNAAKPAGA